MTVEAVNHKPIRRALISVYDKTGLSDIAAQLHQTGVTILATGSTAKTIRDANIPVTRVEDYTGFPEMLAGRVKTLHPRIHAGLLAQSEIAEHMAQLQAHDIAAIDLVIINLYPFADTVSSGANFNESIEQIDIGGPAILRSAAKNHSNVAVISDPAQYPLLRSALTQGGFTLSERTQLAIEAFRKTSHYDLVISQWLTKQCDGNEEMTKTWEKVEHLRYGENPHQSATLYREPGSSGIVSAQQLHGKAMSFNNYTDADAAWRSVWDHREPCVVIFKHANPCGVAIGRSTDEAYRKALACDPLSAFGGVVAANHEVSLAMANELAEVFTEVVIAPSYENGAVEVLAKKPSMRILLAQPFKRPESELKVISGGALIQTFDAIDQPGDAFENWKQVSGGDITNQIRTDLVFAWRTVRSVKSNAIVCAKDGATIGIGMGQVNRIDSARLAVSRGDQRITGCVAASDAFFPFADGLQILIDAGVKAVVQPGGSVRDDEVIAAADRAGIAMFFTGVRHFSHS